MSFREIAVDERRRSQIPLLNRPAGLGLEGVSLGRCLACGKDVLPRDRTVELHGSTFHASCSRYRPPQMD